MSSSEHTIVIGGGVSGLLAARNAALTGRPVTVIEAEPHVGGAVWSHQVGGVECHTGAEAFAIGRGAVLGLVKELGIDSKMASPATGTSFIVTDHGAYPSPKNAIMGMPAKAFAPDVRRAIGVVGTLRVAVEKFLPANVGLKNGVSIGEFTRARYGRRVLERLVAPIIQGVHSADPNKFELSAVLPQLPGAIREHGSAQTAIEHMLRERGKRSGSGAAVHSLVPSMAELPKALARDIEELGGTILTGRRITGIRVGEGADGSPTWTVSATKTPVEENQWRVESHEAGSAQPEAIDAEEKVTGPRLVIATGPDTARELLRDVSSKVSALIPQAPPTPVRLVTLALDNPELDAKPRGNGVLVAPGSQTIRAKAMTHASAKWEHVGDAARVVKPGRHIVRLSYGRGDGGDLPSESEFPALAVKDAAKILGLQPSTLNVADWAITNWTGTMRQTGPGHTRALEQLTQVLSTEHQAADAPLPHLELTGAWRAGNGLEAITRFSRELHKEGHTL